MPEEVDATFALLKHVKAWMDERYHLDGYYAGRGIRYWLKQPANRWW